MPNGAYPVGQLPRARCHGKSNERPDKDSLSDVYVRLDADYGYEDKGAESDNITPKDHLPAAENEYEEDELPNNNNVYVSSGIESSPPLEKGTSELVKAIGDGGCCPWISSNIRFCEDYLNFNFSSSSSLRSIDNK